MAIACRRRSAWGSDADLGAEASAERVGQGRTTVSASSPIVSDASAHQRVFEDFIKTMTAGAPPCCDGRDGRKSVALIRRSVHSSRTNEPFNCSTSRISFTLGSSVHPALTERLPCANDVYDSTYPSMLSRMSTG
jgi:hypothetical protein